MAVATLNCREQDSLPKEGEFGRPNIWRLSILMWLTRPSTGPEFQQLVRPWSLIVW